LENATVIMQWILAAMFSFSAAVKFLRTESMVRHWNEYRYPMWFMFSIASLELVGVIGIVAAIWAPAWLLKVASALFAALMIGAVHAHLFRAKHKPLMAINAFLMFALSAVLLLQG